MSWLFKLLDAAGVNQAGVDANSQVKVALPTTPANAGYGALLSRSEPGGAGSARSRAMLGTINNRLLVGQSQYLWDDTFNATSQNINKYKFGSITQTASQAGGQLVLNTAASVATGTTSGIQSWKAFPLFGNSELRFIMTGMVASGFPHVTQNTIEFGLFSCNIVAAAAPTDGVFFRYNSANELRGVISYNAVETQTAAITQPSVGVAHDFMIITSNDAIEFWIDNEFRAAIDLTVDAPALGQPFLTASQPITIRQYLGGVAPASATKFIATDVFVKMEGPDTGRPFAHAKAGYGHMAYQGQNGGTLSSTGLNTNGAASAAAAPTNTAASLGTGLGGRFHETLTLAAGTDGILCSYQNPAGGVNQTPRNLVITGVTVSGVVTAALTTNPLAGFLSLCFGHSAVSLATADSGSFVSPTVKAPRKIAIGTTSIASATAAIGTPVVGPYPITLQSPIVVAPGEFIAISHNKITAAPATGAVLWTIMFDGYYE
jgi:hypothetical protein